MIEDIDQGIQVWKVDPKEWSTGERKVEGSFKRQKLAESTMVTETYMKCQSGVACMTWPNEDILVAGCTDHQLKVFDMNKLTVSESIFTNHKVVTCLDSAFDQAATIVGGHEDGSVRLYDLRSNYSGGVKQHKVFEANTSYISQVRICPRNANLFAASGYDGRIRLWDQRNESEPLHVLKRKGAEEFKLFALSWVGSSLVSGGSDSSVNIFTAAL